MLTPSPALVYLDVSESDVDESDAIDAFLGTAVHVEAGTGTGTGTEPHRQLLLVSTRPRRPGLVLSLIGGASTSLGGHESTLTGGVDAPLPLERARRRK